MRAFFGVDRIVYLLDNLFNKYMDYIDLLDNTFFGTLFAGSLIAILGYIFYKKQKILDIFYRKEEEKQKKCDILLKHLRISVDDCRAQVDVRNGKNSIAKNIYDFIESTYSNFISRSNSIRFRNYVDKINDSFDELKLFLIPEDKYKTERNELQNLIPSITFYLAGVDILEEKNVVELEKKLQEAENILKKIGKVKD
ncbi:hypothetical protein C4565_04180 [Candidatus Parcubacteria bacterium]|jgi:hypothetical protein|nr:MAG: hypothetical protein C4565_04180 [Candidatus Parcubacteria bacterium]